MFHLFRAGRPRPGPSEPAACFAKNAFQNRDVTLRQEIRNLLAEAPVGQSELRGEELELIVFFLETLGRQGRLSISGSKAFTVRGRSGRRAETPGAQPETENQERNDGSDAAGIPALQLVTASSEEPFHFRKRPGEQPAMRG